MVAMPAAIVPLLRHWTARLTALASLAVILICGWLASMELALRHQSYGWRLAINTAVIVSAGLTLAVVEELIDANRLRWPLAAGGATAAVLGGWVVAEDVSRPGLPARPHFEGYLLIAGLALIGYGVLTIATM